MVAASAAALSAAGVAVWGVLIEPRLLQKRLVHAWIPNLPGGWEGQRMAILGDLQVGAPLANTDAIHRAVREAVAARPGLVLLTGDYVYNATLDAQAIIGHVVDLVRPLVSATVPVLGVLGNHDFAAESTADRRRMEALAHEVERALERVGVQILRNEAREVAAAGDALYVVGIGEREARQDDWRAAFDQVPRDAARVVLAHDPLALKSIPGGWAPLALAGHTHGGQIRVPSKQDWTPARWVTPWPEYVDGWIEGFLEPGNRLYVNRGIGFSKLPLRIGAPPELTLVTLHRE